MKTRPLAGKQIVLASLLVCAAATAPTPALGQGVEPYRIQITRRTESQRKGDVRRLPLRNVRVRPSSSDVYFSIELRRMTPSAPEEVTLETLIVLETPMGRVFPGGYSRESVQLPLGIATTLETDSVVLESFEWRNRGGGDGVVGTKLLGYAVRLLDADGKVLAARYQPKEIEKDTDRLIEEWNRALKNENPPPGGAPGQPAPPPGWRPPWRM